MKKKSNKLTRGRLKRRQNSNCHENFEEKEDKSKPPKLKVVKSRKGGK